MGVLLLGVAYGTAEEGIATKTMVDPHSSAAAFLSVYGRLFGVNWVFAVVIAIFHAVFSIGVPILLVGLVFPADRERRFLSDRGELWALATLSAAVVIGYLGFDPRYFEGEGVLTALGVAVGMCVLAARWCPVSWREPPTPAPTASPGFFAGLGATFSGGWAIAYLVVPRVTPWPVVAIGMEVALALIVLALGVQRAGRSAHERHAVYLVGGLLAWYLVWDPIISFALSDYLVLLVLAALYYGLYRLSQRYPDSEDRTAREVPGTRI